MKTTVITTHLKSNNITSHKFATELEAKEFFHKRMNTIDDFLWDDNFSATGSIYKIELK